MNYKDRYNKWINSPYIDELTKKELLNIKDDEKEIEDRFYKELEFGTGGIRGVLGAGDNRINIYTIAKASKGLANYINSAKTKNEESVCIAYDSRHMSYELAKTSALVLNNNGIKTYLFKQLTPTPMLSFAIRELKSIAGIVITASHNPAKYNGFKVYWEDGAQITSPIDSNIINCVNAVKEYDDARILDEKIAIECGLYNIIDDDVNNKYYDNVINQIVDKNIINKMGDSLKIVYTPLNGTGNIPVMTVLEKAGFNNVYIVKEQEKPDPDFTTVGYPNPEEPKVFELAKKVAIENDCDIIIGTDPDADRVGAVVKNKNGEFVNLSGNVTGVLLTNYILKSMSLQNKLSEKTAVVSTIVSTDMAKSICKKYGVAYFETLTGFKYIGEKIKEFSIDNSYEFAFGFEESYGCLKGTYTRDKDAVVTSLLLCEMASYYKSKGMTLYDAIFELYEEYGYYKDDIKTISLEGIDGLKQIQKVLDVLRENPLTKVCDAKTIEYKDYKLGVVYNYINNTKGETNLPTSNVLYYNLDNDCSFCIRPSGTEPKIKIYFGAKDSDEKLVDEKLKKLIKFVINVINKI